LTVNFEHATLLCNIWLSLQGLLMSCKSVTFALAHITSLGNECLFVKRVQDRKLGRDRAGSRTSSLSLNSAERLKIVFKINLLHQIQRYAQVSDHLSCLLKALHGS